MKIAIWLYRILWLIVGAILYVKLDFLWFGGVVLLIGGLVYLKEMLSYGNYSAQLQDLKDVAVHTIEAQQNVIAELTAKSNPDA